MVRDCWLPADLAPGDLLAVAATGAYCYAMASAYNQVPRPAVVAVRDGAAARCCCAGRPSTTCSAWRWLVSRDGAAELASREAIRVACSAAARSAREVVRLLREQADDLAARVGAPVELVGVAVRRPHRHPELRPSCSPPTRRRWSRGRTWTSSSR